MRSFRGCPRFEPVLDAKPGTTHSQEQSNPGYGTVFLASPLMTVDSEVPSGSTAEVKRNRNCRMLSSHMSETVAVRSKFPDESNSPKVVVPVQLEFTEYVPESEELVTLPFRLDVTLPLIFPDASRLS